jgi:hypothetical protein
MDLGARPLTDTHKAFNYKVSQRIQGRRVFAVYDFSCKFGGATRDSRRHIHEEIAEYSGVHRIDIPFVCQKTLPGGIPEMVSWEICGVFGKGLEHKFFATVQATPEL